MEGLGLSRARPTAAVAAALFLAVVLLFLYWRYPFDGMVISDSWYFYASDGGPFRWYTKAHLVYRETVEDPLERGAFRPTWSTLYTNRGLIPVVAWAIDALGAGDPVSVNLLCILVQLVNAAVFAYVVWRVAGAEPLLPVFVCALLYPFAAGSHFWQFLIVNNLAATFFLLSLAIFLSLGHGGRASPRFVAGGLASLGCFWISLLLVNYANFMGPLSVYLGLYLSNGRRALLRFPRWRTPSFGLGLGFVALDVAAVIFFSRDVPSFLAYGARFQELGARIGLPPLAVGLAAVGGNAVLTYLSILFSNSVGMLLYPLVTVAHNFGVVTESAWTLAAIVAIAVGATTMLFAFRPRSAAVGGTRDDVVWRFGMIVGLGWAALAYLPFTLAFGYPRVVGLAADRVNILASWGVALALGIGLHRLVGAVTGQRRALWAAAVTLGVALLLANLHIQREAYVEAYRKERAVAGAVLLDRMASVPDGRQSVVLLHRAQIVRYPRERLLGALGDGNVLHRGLRLLSFAVDRYFIAEPTTSSFNLEGLMLFGCCPQTAPTTFDGYARRFKVPRVPVYKEEPPLELDDEGPAYRIGYRDVQVWSASFGAARLSRYPRQTHRLVRLELAESFFRLRGAARFRALPGPLGPG